MEGLKLALDEEPDFCDGALADVFASLRASLNPNIPPDGVVEAALLSKKLPQEQMDQLISNGTILNRPNDVMAPRLSIFQLFSFADKYPDEFFAPALRALTLLEIRERSMHKNARAGPMFEQFHAHWKQLMTILRGRTNGGSLADYYNGGII